MFNLGFKYFYGKTSSIGLTRGRKYSNVIAGLPQA